jgi:hypothetical protein
MYSLQAQPPQPPSVSITKGGGDVILYEPSSRPTGVMMPPVIKHHPPTPHDSPCVVDLVKDIAKKNLSMVDAAGNSLETDMSPQTIPAKKCARLILESRNEGVLFSVECVAPFSS